MRGTIEVPRHTSSSPRGQEQPPSCVICSSAKAIELSVRSRTADENGSADEALNVNMTPFALAPSLASQLTRRGTHARILTAQPSYVPVRKPTCEHRPSLSLLGLCETRTSHACLSSTTQARRRHTQVQVYARTTSAPAFRCGEREEAVMLICLPALWMREGDGARVRLSGAHVFPSRYGWPLVSPYSGKRAQSVSAERGCRDGEKRCGPGFAARRTQITERRDEHRLSHRSTSKDRHRAVD